MKYITRTLLSLLAVAGIVLMLQPQSVHAIDAFEQGCEATPNSAICKEAKNGETETSGLIQTVIETLIYIVGVISVIMIIVGGIRYTLSNGDSSKVTSAKNTVLYAVIGLVVAILAFAIVNFVIAQF